MGGRDISDTSIGIATDYGLIGQDSFPGRGKIFLFSTASRPAFTSGSFSGDKAAGACSWRYMGKWRYSPTVIDLGTKWRWVVSFVPQPLYPRANRFWYPLERRLGGPQNNIIILIVMEVLNKLKILMIFVRFEILSLPWRQRRQVCSKHW
jgi:hypothetical protein